MTLQPIIETTQEEIAVARQSTVPHEHRHYHLWTQSDYDNADPGEKRAYDAWSDAGRTHDLGRADERNSRPLAELPSARP